MKKRLLKIVLGTFIFALAILGVSFRTAKASTVYDNEDNTSVTYQEAQFGASATLDFYGQNFPASYAINNLTFKIETDLNGGCQPYFKLSIDGGNKNFTSFTYEGGYLIFDTPGLTGNDLNLHNGSTQLLILNSGFSSFTSCTGNVTVYGNTATSTYWGSSLYYDGTPDLASVSVWVNGVTPGHGTSGGSGGLANQDLSQNFIIFSDPPYTDGVYTPDFLNWQTCINIVNGSSGTSYGYDVQIDYGTSTPDVWHDSLHDQLQAYAPLLNLPMTECPIIAKTATSSPGDYVAIATLYRHRPISGDQFIATSSLFHFTVASGTPVSYPGQYQEHIACPATDYELFGWDYGKALCSTADYLFSPSKESLNLFGGLWTTISKKPPLGWFSTSQSNIAGVSTSTPATVVFTNISFFGALKDAIDVGIALLVVVSFSFFIWHRIRKFDFHI